MAWSAVVFCRDAEALSVLSPGLHELGIVAEMFALQALTLERVAARKFDAVVFDCDAAEGMPPDELLRSVRQASLNNRLVVVALVSDPSAMQPAFNQGANFVVCKPLAREIMRRTLRAATCMLYRMARRFPRRTVHTLSLVTIDGVADKAMLMQLAEGGMGVQALEPLEVSRSLTLRFEIPGTRTTVEATGEIAWADASGRVGIRFAQMSDQDQARVREWVFGDALDTASPLASIPEEVRTVAQGKLFLTPGPQRLGAALLDGCIVLAATAVFELLVLGMVRTAPHAIMAQATTLGVPCLFWSVYQYLFLHGVTPGMHLAGAIGRQMAGHSAGLGARLLSPVVAAWRAIVRLGARIDVQGSVLLPTENAAIAHISIQPPAQG